MSRFDSIDPDEGGESERHSLFARWRSGDWSVLAYGVHYAFDLWSNFTFYSADPEAGDMIHQSDRRWTTGGEITWRHDHELFGRASTTTIGMRLRGDAIENGLAAAPGRQDRARSVDASVFEASAGVFAEQETEWTPWLRSVLGVRADTFGFDVEDRLGEGDGTAADALVSPKASAIFTPVEDLDLYVNFGTGFHSNDARGVVRGVTPLSRAVGGEVGARVRLLDRVDLAAAGFVLDLASETVWVGDAGTTEARGATRRFGVELEARAELLSWLHADVDFTATRAEYVENPSNADAVALAPTRMISGGLTARHPTGLFGRIGAVHIADRPATEDGTLIAEGFTRVDATAGWRNERVELSVSVQNLLDTEWREAQFANVSRLPHESTPATCPAGTRAVGDGADFEGCEDVHFTPGAPLNIQANATLRF
jgi:outer membrane receptor protein involved in Fe transport